MSSNAVVDSLDFAVRTDYTALKFAVKKKTVRPGNIAYSCPHLIAALREAAEKSELDPRRAGDALVTLSILAMHDSTLGDDMAIINRVLEPTGNTLRRHLSDYHRRRRLRRLSSRKPVLAEGGRQKISARHR